MGRPKKVESKNFQLELDFKGTLKSIEKSKEARDLVIAMIRSKNKQRNQWRGLMAVPPTSLLEHIISQFQENTNIPLEIPFFTFFCMVSGYLLINEINLDICGKKIIPDIWTVILASSGAGKTYTENEISDGLIEVMKKIEFQGTGCVSSAAFINELKDKPRGLWVRDEFAQFLKQIENPNGPLSEMKDYLLRVFDNAEIQRKTKKDGLITIQCPALSILGLTVVETFKNYVTTESMLDGFAQRFCYVVAESDPQRHFLDYPIWRIENKSWQKRWEKIIKSLHSQYYSSEDLISAFAGSFQVLYSQKIPESFYRRIMWKAHKYALIYHIIREDVSKDLKAEDYGWAARALSLHIDDAAYLIGEHNLSPLERLIQAAEKIFRKSMIDTGKPPNPRDLISGIKAIKNASEAKAILEIVKESFQKD
ncbi:MAG: DUF3987 domain-containing protein [Desulfobacterales bacterium]|nr:DUF3987 domain-containing protein [Desulfobacterales bacterium]